MSFEGGSRPDVEIDWALAQFELGLEERLLGIYRAKAEQDQELHDFAGDYAQEATAVLCAEDQEVQLYKENVRNGFYRIFMDFSNRDDSGEITTVSAVTLVEVLSDIERNLGPGWGEVAREWSTLSFSMLCIENDAENQLVRPVFDNPDVRFSYLYEAVKFFGSATGNLGVLNS